MAVEFQALAVGIIDLISEESMPRKNGLHQLLKIQKSKISLISFIENTLVSLIKDVSRFGRSMPFFSSMCPQLCKNIFSVKSFYLVGGTWKKASCLLCVKSNKYAFWVTLRLLRSIRLQKLRYDARCSRAAYLYQNSLQCFITS